MQVAGWDVCGQDAGSRMAVSRMQDVGFKLSGWLQMLAQELSQAVRGIGHSRQAIQGHNLTC